MLGFACLNNTTITHITVISTTTRIFMNVRIVSDKTIDGRVREDTAIDTDEVHDAITGAARNRLEPLGQLPADRKMVAIDVRAAHELADLKAGAEIDVLGKRLIHQTVAIHVNLDVAIVVSDGVEVRHLRKLRKLSLRKILVWVW